MKVTIKDLLAKIELKNRGIELDIYDKEDNHLGDLIVTKANLIWCKGKTTKENGKKISWNKFITLMEERKR